MECNYVNYLYDDYVTIWIIIIWNKCNVNPVSRRRDWNMKDVYEILCWVVDPMCRFI